MYGGFHYMFPLGRDKKVFGGSGTVRASLLRRMMRFYDPRFAQNTSFLYLVFSQAMRHDATQQVARLKDGAHMQRFKAIINEPSFDEQMDYAIVHPESDEAKALDRKLTPYVRFTGQNISWSAQQRGNIKTKTYSMMQVYGPAT